MTRFSMLLPKMTNDGLIPQGELLMGAKLIRASGPGPRCLLLAQVAKFLSR